MKSDSGDTTSVWMTTAEKFPTDGKLTADVHTDVCVIGAGIAGLTTAYLLVKEGKRVVVLEDGVVGGGMTGRTTAHLFNALDDRFYHLESLHGAEGARMAAESHTAAIDRIESIIKAENIECEFERLDGYLFAPSGEGEKLERELRAAHRAGLADVTMVDRAPIPDYDTGPCLRFPRQAQFHPLNYLAGLTHAIRRDGGKVYTRMHATSIEGGTPAQVNTSDGFRVTAEAVVVATNSPVNDRFTIHTKQAAYMSYVIGARVPEGSVPKALYWDTLDPYHYVRLQSMRDEEGPYDLLIVGGEDHKTGQANDAAERYAALERWTKARFPMMTSVEFQWSGQVMEPVDSLAYIGHNPLDSKNVYIATGDSGQGMTHGTIAGMLLTDLIMGRESSWQTLYDPGRKTLRSLPEFLHHNLNVAAQYSDLIKSGDVKSTDDIIAGEGAIMRRGLMKIAVYRDTRGELHECSAICSHLGGVVHWNSREKTWDCPCHGSRFTAYGKVFQGPANKDLPVLHMPPMKKVG